MIINKHEFLRLPSITPEQVTLLTDLAKELKFTNATGSRRRVGANGTEALSTYHYSKWFDWTAKQRATYRKAWTDEQLKTVVQGWFVRYPKRTGFLDEMNVWVDKPNSGTILGISLEDGQVIKVDGKLHTVNKGEVIKFNVSLIHSVPKVRETNLWACIMIREILI